MLIYNAEIHTMDSDEMIPNGWVEVREGKITDIGSGAPNLIPEDCIDAKGGMLLPGFIDAHTHLGIIEDGFDLSEVRLAFLLEYFGNGHFLNFHDEVIGVAEAAAEFFCRELADSGFSAAHKAAQKYSHDIIISGYLLFSFTAFSTSSIIFEISSAANFPPYHIS